MVIDKDTHDQIVKVLKDRAINGEYEAIKSLREIDADFRYREMLKDLDDDEFTAETTPD